MDNHASCTDSGEDVDVLRRLASGRFTCRAYRPEAVPTDVIENIVDIAKRTPSWCNVQPWQLVVTSCKTTEKFREALLTHAALATDNESDLPFPKDYLGVYAERRREVGYQLYDALGISRTDRERRAMQSFENFRLFGAPHVAIITLPVELGTYGAVDCGAFIGAFLMAAHAHGVSTTPQAALARHARFIRSYFGIGENRNMICGIAFGYADREHPINRFRTGRAPLSEIMRVV